MYKRDFAILLTIFRHLGYDLDLFIAFHSPTPCEATLHIILTAPEFTKQLTHSVCCCPDHARMHDKRSDGDFKPANIMLSWQDGPLQVWLEHFASTHLNVSNILALPHQSAEEGAYAFTRVHRSGNKALVPVCVHIRNKMGW